MTERAQALEAAIEKARRGLIGFAAEIQDGRVPVVGAVRDHLVLNLGTIASFLADALVAVQPPPPVGSPTTEDVTCEHGTAMDVHCCNCHSGFIFDMAHECPAPELTWREAVEQALGVESDHENHTPQWAFDVVRAIREIGNQPTPVEPAGAHVETLRQMVGMAGEFRQTLLTVRECIDALTPGHRTGYDWNADPLYMTRYVGDALKAIDAGLKSLNGQAAVPTYRNVYIVTHYPDGGLRGVHASQAGAEAEIADLCREYPKYSRRDFSVTCDRIRPFVEPAGASEPPSDYMDIEPDIRVVRVYRDGSWLEDMRGGGRRRASFPEPAPVSPVEPTPEPPQDGGNPK